MAGHGATLITIYCLSSYLLIPAFKPPSKKLKSSNNDLDDFTSAPATRSLVNY